jgi:hypothetical protein
MIKKFFLTLMLSSSVLSFINIQAADQANLAFVLVALHQQQEEKANIAASPVEPKPILFKEKPAFVNNNNRRNKKNNRRNKNTSARKR